MTIPTRISADHNDGLREGRTPQIRRWTTQSTLISERAVKASATPPSTRATMRLARDMVLVLVIALASRPLMPADRAASFGLWLAAVDARPKPVTMTKA